MLLTLQIKYQGQAEHDKIVENAYQLTLGINTSTILLTSQGIIFKCIPLHDFKIYSF